MKEIITAIAASDTKTILHVVHYKPEHEVIGVIQVLHGMTEHIGRYKEFAKFFTDKGYAVIGHDMIGYGKTKSYGMKETYLALGRCCDGHRIHKKIYTRKISGYPYLSIRYRYGCIFWNGTPNSISGALL